MTMRFMMSAGIAAVLGITAGLSACAKKEASAEAPDAVVEEAVEAVEEVIEDATAETTAAAIDPSKIASDNLAASKKFLADNAKRDGIQVTASGLQYEVISKGSGDGAVKPAATDIVNVHYVGTLINGEEFDSSRARGAPATFPLNRVIPGWTEGLQLMNEGDRFRFYLPPEIGYGEAGAGASIGPNSALIFDVELLSVVNPARNLEKTKAFFEENATKDGVKTTESGLQYIVENEGAADGKTPSDASVIKVHVETSSLDGKKLNSTRDRGSPIQFPLSRAPIAGWTEGLKLMSEGDKFKFFMPPELAFGPGGSGPIGPNEGVIFDMELVEVSE